ncbi:ring-cleaving dioxygenase [Paenibacillus sp. GCM10027627]|uniref:ring-cleaving dioxygenase n=1 Tax=unclassified Paenibacillus TaxID=185978 RepID=UPI003630375F
MYTINGHHHVSMLTKDAKATNHFFRDILGLRRVKKTVNQDDPSMYHLFYGDLTGSAGTELSFFEMPMAGHTVRGTDAITGIGLLVQSRENLDYWKARFEQFRVKHGEITTYAGHDALHFEDGEGLRMVIINHNEREVPDIWSAWDGSDVPEEHRILGIGSMEITVSDLNSLATTLTGIFGYTEVFRSEDEAVYQAEQGLIFGEIVIKQQDGPREKPGKGSIHHLAIRVNNEEELQYWDKAVRDRGFRSSGIIDRFYFQSLYFRESNGILFEIATDGPGFTADSTIEDLGKGLDLPPFLEVRRADIEARLAPID